MFKRLSLMLTLLAASQTLMAQGPAQFVGTWKLLSFETEIQATGERRLVFGKNPSGYLILNPDGRLMAIVAGEGRKPAETDQDRATLQRSLIAYTGMYRVDGDRIVTQVDVSWNEAWTGTEVVRFLKLDGNRLDVVTTWTTWANIPGRPIARAITSWERVK